MLSQWFAVLRCVQKSQAYIGCPIRKLTPSICGIHAHPKDLKEFIISNTRRAYLICTTSV